MSNFKAATLVSSLLFLVSTYSVAQGPCPVATSLTQNVSLSSDLVCAIPQVYGSGGLVGTNHGGPLVVVTNPPHEVHFQASSLQSLTPLNAEIGTQLSQLPITSPASGFVFSFNPSLGVVSRSTETFGPILAERADTIGKHKLFLGVSYQYFDFNKADGVDLRSFGTVYTHATPAPDTVKDDIIATNNRIDLKVHQVTLVGTFGITNRLDVSLAIPVVDVRMGFSSDASIFTKESPAVHQFASPAPDPSHETFLAADHALFFNHNSAFGIGDLIVRGKFQALKREKVGLAAGIDFHIPTGNEENFLGSGTFGARPFVTFSYSGRISPHATLGYQINGNSILAGDITKGTEAHLPNILTYSAGADAGITRRLSVALDFLGQALQDAKTIASSTFTDFNGTPRASLTSSAATINQASIAVGGKVNPIGKLLLTANVLFRINDAGLHSKPAPLVGISYTF
ncbi:MAG TPA: transporter [Terriglobales bacterium]